MLEDIYIPSADACMLLGVAVNTQNLHRYKIPHKKEFTSLYWSRNAIYAILKERRILSSVPKGYVDLEGVAEMLKCCIDCAVRQLKKYKVPYILTRMYTNGRYSKRRVYALADVRKMAQKYSFLRSSYPPEGWLTIHDVSDYLHLKDQQCRKLCHQYKVRMKPVTARKYIYNEDDIVALRKTLYRRKNQYKYNY